MRESSPRRRSVLGPLLAGAAGVALALGLGCAGTLYTQVRYDYFAAPDPADPWSLKIAFWQRRERAERSSAPMPATAPVAGSGDVSTGGAGVGDLKTKYDAYRGERKRAMARDLARWIQEQAREHYLPDGPVDHWATLEETFRGNGDDCDGLELLVYHFLRDLGFSEDEVYRAIVFRRSDGQHHMVTFWFEDPEDPWVIDPTGAMTSGMPRMSELTDWTPLKVFSESEDFTVRGRFAARGDP